MIIQERTTSLSPREVIERACRYFALSPAQSTAYPDLIGERHLRLRFDMGEAVFGILPEGEGNRVRASASRALPMVARFLSTLEPLHPTLPDRLEVRGEP